MQGTETTYLTELRELLDKSFEAIYEAVDSARYLRNARDKLESVHAQLDIYWQEGLPTTIDLLLERVDDLLDEFCDVLSNAAAKIQSMDEGDNYLMLHVLTDLLCRFLPQNE